MAKLNSPQCDSLHLAGLFRRTACWWPTWRAFALLLCLAMAGGAVGIVGVYPFLAVTEPCEDGPIVVMGWERKNTLEVALAEYRRRGEPAFFVAGRPLDAPLLSEPPRSWADLTARELERLGAKANELRVVPAPFGQEDGSYACAVALRDAMSRDGGLPRELTLILTGPGAR